MSMEPWEADQEAFIDALANELYEEHRDQAIEEFVGSRMRSYYETHRTIPVGPLLFLRKAKELVESEPTASLLLSCAATEVVLKDVLVKPVVFGLVHTDSLAELIASHLVRQSGIDRFKEIVFQILDHHIDFGEGFSKYKRPGSTKALWIERGDIQGVRNGVVHRAEFCGEESAQRSLEIGAAFFSLTKTLVEGFGFRIDTDGQISD